MAKYREKRERRAYSGCFDGLGNDREVVEAFFDEKADDAVRVEEEVTAAGVFVADDGVQSLELGCLWQGEDGGRQRCRSCLGGGRVVDDHGG